MKVSSLYLFLLICSGTLGEKENQGTMPKHVAIILDGNRRWAKKNGLKIAERSRSWMQKSLGYDWGLFHWGDKHCFTLCFLYWKLEKTPGDSKYERLIISREFQDIFLSVLIQWFFFLSSGWSSLLDGHFWIFCQDDDTSSPQVSQHVIFILFLELKKKNVFISKEHFCTMDVNVYFWSFYEALYVNISFLL